MAIAVLVNRYRSLILKMAPLLVLALIWLWFLVAVLVLSAHVDSLKPLIGWGYAA